MDLIKRTDDQYEKYEDLLVERDQARKEAQSVWISYVQTFGALIADVFEEKLECVKLKKTIAYYQAALNHGGVVDPEAMREYLNNELALYYKSLKQMQQDNELCRDAKTSTNYAVKRSKTLYRRLAKLLHPDINPETDRNEALQDLWQQILTAYGHNDLKALAELEVLARKALKELGAGEIRVDIPDLEERIASLQEETREIKSTEPYSYRELLEDPEAVGQKLAGLKEELETYRKYRKELEEVIQTMIESGGITFQWLMN